MCVAFILACFSIFQNGCVDVRDGIYNNIFLFIFNATSMCLIIYSAIQLLLPNNDTSYFALYLKYLGENAITYVCFNELAISISLLLAKKTISAAVPLFLIHSGVLLLSLFILYIANGVIINSKLKVFLGKGK